MARLRLRLQLAAAHSDLPKKSRYAKQRAAASPAAWATEDRCLRPSISDPAIGRVVPDRAGRGENLMGSRRQQFPIRREPVMRAKLAGSGLLQPQWWPVDGSARYRSK